MKIDKKILKTLKLVLKDNVSLKDIWVYGSLSDKASDLDLIFVYKNLNKPIKIPKLIKKKILDGTIIYIPDELKLNIFLFEKLNIFSIKKNKKIHDNIPYKFKEYRSLTSFLERYYERRKKFYSLKKNFNFEKLRILKSIIYSYEQFYQYTKLKKIKFQKRNFLDKYKKFRKYYIINSNKNKILNLLNHLIDYDRSFCKQSTKILDDKFHYKNKINFRYKFNKNVKYDYNIKKTNDIPYILGQLFNYYSLKNLSLSKKIRKDFFPRKKIYVFEKNFQNYLDKKIYFLNKSYKDLKKIKLKKGLYRLTWYL